ncbi:hypothetical protein YC2023_085273 [Brassica napus]
MDCFCYNEAIIWYNSHVVIKIQPNLLKSEYNQTKIELQIFSKADCLHYFIPNKWATI